MPRRQFISDLQEASEPGKFPHLTNVTAGEDDGTISCTFVPVDTSVDPIEIALLLTDISDYPNSHGWIVYTTSTGDVPSEATRALEELPDEISGLSVSSTLLQLTTALEKSLGPPSEDNSFLEYPSGASDVESFSEAEESQHEPDYSDIEDEWFSEAPSTSKPLRKNGPDGAVGDAKLLSRLADDLTQVKLAGFKVGYLGNRIAPIVCVSCRIAKLGISDEAMEAWQVDAQQYLVLMIRYVGRYSSLEEILQHEGKYGSSPIDIHFDLCDYYKPSHQDAINTFDRYREPSSEDSVEQTNAEHSKTQKTQKMTQSFVSKPLNALLRERFVKILGFRYSLGFSWEGAEQFLNDFQGKFASEQADDRYMTDGANDAAAAASLPSLVTSDHLTDGSGENKSFPLICMQFVLRHFVRCTEFCLVCHCKTNDSFEALKPYVCSKNLCLFQYMSLGFGPSLEWEILSQPYVVDLLISFTYASAQCNRLSDFPTGLGLLVPVCGDPVYQANTGYVTQGTWKADNSKENPSVSPSKLHNAKFDGGSMELVFPNASEESPVSTGDWIFFRDPTNSNTDLHCYVRDASLFPTVRLSKPVYRIINRNHQGNESSFFTSYVGNITFAMYDKSFDDLSQYHRRGAIMMLLDLLPSVEEMQKFISDHSKSTLANWRERIPKSALYVLRWIIASNRSCIIQEDPSQRSRDDRVYGMDQYMQFRFAQGAPDKEQRFLQSVAAETEKKNSKYPTLFAWHGSSLANWHGIVREGLHFRDVLHGRACGNGVYMASDFNTSNSFSAMGGWNPPPQAAWPQSILNVRAAISLNEVVNRPDKFVCKAPFVVAQLDWIQTRYLFVQCSNNKHLPKTAVTKPAEYYEQDPTKKALGPNGSPIIIPMTVFSQQRRMGMGATPPEETVKQADGRKSKSSKSPSKKRRLKKSSSSNDSEKGKDNGQTEDGGWASDETENDDLQVLFVAQDENIGNGKENARSPSPSTPKTPFIDSSKTDFVPGTLDGKTLPLLGPPTYATPGASKALQRELKATLQIQDTHPLHDLGWYIDPNLINTVYQWIVELHSFDENLPLTKDLRKAGLRSVVMEIRFSKDYPISPPFVRVIRPRFLGFQQGGGGHVTAGGALCMELLTNSGWSAVANVESVLLQVRMAVSSTEPRPGRLEPGQDAKKGTVRNYEIAEAVHAYVRACRVHGWKVPEDFEQGNSLGGWGAAAN